MVNYKEYPKSFVEEQIKLYAGASYSPSITNLFVYLLELEKQGCNLLPKYKGDENLGVYIKRWVSKYFSGYNNRPSQRKGNPPTTVPDNLVKAIFIAISSPEGSALADKIAEGHSLMMTIENFIGDLLEEYLHLKLQHKGWICCWGQTVKHVDFVHIRKSILLQVKTSDNSENSSSVKVREGTTIEKWHRRKSKVDGGYCWDELVKITGEKSFSEENFRKFIFETIDANKSCIHIPIKNPIQGDLLK